MNKRNIQKGFTLVEMLCVVLLISLLSMGMVTGVSLAQRQFVKSMQRSQAPQLYTTLESLLTNELRYTTDITVDSNGTVETMYSTTYAIKESLTKIVSLDEDDQETSGYGEIAFGNGGTYNKVLGSSAYPHGLGAIVSITYNGTYFTVDLDVGSDTTGSIVQDTFDVKPLNTMTVEKTS